MKLISRLSLCLALFLFLSCGASQKKSSSVASRSYSYKSESGDNTPEDPAITRFIVPPELAVIKGKINSSATSFDEVTELLTINSNKLQNGVSQIKGCDYNLLDYQHPLTWGSRKSIASNSNKYSGSLEFEVLIALTEQKKFIERSKQINSCLKAIPKLKLEENQKDKNSNLNLSLSGALLTVKDAGKYRQKLLAFKSKPFKEVVKLSEPPIQYDAKDYKCSSQGNVKVVTRKLSGIELDIDFDCRRLTKGN